MDNLIVDRTSWQDWFMHQKLNHDLRELQWMERVLWEDVVAPLIKEEGEVGIEGIKKYIERLQNGEPLAYVSGQVHFFGLAFRITQDVLIPRAETEELVAWILEEHPDVPVRVLDVGTGSGIIPVVLKKKRPNWEVLAIDISREALRIAEQNAQIHQVEVNWLELDLFASSTVDRLSKIDLIVSNPPYIPLREKEVMESSTLQYEPAQALFVPDDDPLLFYCAIQRIAVDLNATFIYFELNEFQVKAYRHWVNTLEGWQAEFREDLQGKTRMLRLQKS